MNKALCLKFFVVVCAIGLVFALSGCTRENEMIYVSGVEDNSSQATDTSAENQTASEDSIGSSNSSAINQTVISNAEQSGINGENFFSSVVGENNASSKNVSEESSKVSSETSSVTSVSSNTSSKDFSLENSDAWNTPGSLKPIR